MTSRRWGRYLSPDDHRRPKLDTAKVKAAEKFDGKWVVITNDETLSAEDVALAYEGGMIIESCFRRMNPPYSSLPALVAVSDKQVADREVWRISVYLLVS
jgi:hypothetical protein